MAHVSGPTRSMPGSVHSINTETVCDYHPNRPAAARVQGETDSFGAEYFDLCKECRDKHFESIRNADTSGQCDWCKNHAPKLFSHRDFEEGLCGRIYDVCQACIDRENSRVEEELDSYADDYDYE